MGYWKTKVLPKIQKIFGQDVAKKAAAIEACKSFDESKEEISKELEEKRAELHPKVIEIFEASSTEIKTLIKDPKEAAIKKQSIKVQKFLDELVKVEFPGCKAVSETTSMFGPALVPGPVIFVLEKVSTFIVTEDKTREVDAPAATEETTTTEETSMGEREIVAEEVYELKAKAAAEAGKSAETTAPPKEDMQKVEEPPKQ